MIEAGARDGDAKEAKEDAAKARQAYSAALPDEGRRAKVKKTKDAAKKKAEKDIAAAQEAASAGEDAAPPADLPPAAPKKVAARPSPQNVVLALCELSKGKNYPLSQLTDELAKKVGLEKAKQLAGIARRQHDRGLMKLTGRKGQKNMHFTEECKKKVGLTMSAHPPHALDIHIDPEPDAPVGVDIKIRVALANEAFRVAEGGLRDALVAAVVDYLQKQGEHVTITQARELYKVVMAPKM